MQPNETNTPLRFKKLRIAWSVFCGLACVLLIALWVRSYGPRGSLLGNLWGGRSFSVSLMRGQLEFRDHDIRAEKMPWAAIKSSADRYDALMKDVQPHATIMGFGIDCFFIGGVSNTVLLLPQWFSVLIAATLAVSPWIHWSRRFSLGTLLIAMTLIAVVLGTVVYATR